MCHLDVDVLDPELIPAVNFPAPGGLSVEETMMIVRTLLKTGKVKVLELAAYNAAKDIRGSSVKKIVDLIKAVSG